MVSFTPRPLHPSGKSPRYPLHLRLGGPQSRSGRGDEEKHFQEVGYTNTRVYPKVSGLATWSENCKLYSSLPLGAVGSPFCESV
jgi:hypothetical protein